MKPEEFIVKGYANGREDTCGDVDVMLNNEELPFHFDLCNHSPTGFNWGYSGSGPSQLAFCIIYEYLTKVDGYPLVKAKSLTEFCYHDFKNEFVAKFSQTKDWVLIGTAIEGFMLQWSARNLR